MGVDVDQNMAVGTDRFANGASHAMPCVRKLLGLVEELAQINRGTEMPTAGRESHADTGVGDRKTDIAAGNQVANALSGFLHDGAFSPNERPAASHGMASHRVY